ncbi:hypothetical protein AB6A40_002443 [Gnathostoma spinigerum]|uniref:Uncharacterized protein n=1 Tax=Gnathostoma spinigerum TaxID=75299 RepID=A0ABD6E6L5_9BILA
MPLAPNIAKLHYDAIKCRERVSFGGYRFVIPSSAPCVPSFKCCNHEGVGNDNDCKHEKDLSLLSADNSFGGISEEELSRRLDELDNINHSDDANPSENPFCFQASFLKDATHKETPSILQAPSNFSRRLKACFPSESFSSFQRSPVDTSPNQFQKSLAFPHYRESTFKNSVDPRLRRDHLPSVMYDNHIGSGNRYRCDNDNDVVGESDVEECEIVDSTNGNKNSSEIIGNHISSGIPVLDQLKTVHSPSRPVCSSNFSSSATDVGIYVISPEKPYSTNHDKASQVVVRSGKCDTGYDSFDEDLEDIDFDMVRKYGMLV